ncbi:MAG: STAS/SEC14 domain-containing protein [Sulfitobacter sp.]
MLEQQAVIEIPTSRADLYTFRVTDRLSAEAAGALAGRLNELFDGHEQIDLMIIFDRFEGMDWDAGFNWEAWRADLRSGRNVGRYVIVGAGPLLEEITEAAGRILPLEVESFDDEIPAWRALDGEAIAPVEPVPPAALGEADGADAPGD